MQKKEDMINGTLNKAQIAVLNAVSSLNTDEEVNELKQVITDYFAKRADAALDKLFDEGKINAETLASWETAHYRTPYK
ncbi:MAG: dephospho-CoA kinase [Bacteroidales bacterium]|nr:dephospho-CoA kinase [Bacteroidales bacterium]